MVFIEGLLYIKSIRITEVVFIEGLLYTQSKRKDSGYQEYRQEIYSHRVLVSNIGARSVIVHDG